jgi:hypothetical protein
MLQFTKEDYDQLKLVFVTREECDTTVDKINKDIASHNIDLAVIKNDLALIKKISWLILSLMITAIVGAILARVIL